MQKFITPDTGFHSLSIPPSMNVLISTLFFFFLSAQYVKCSNQNKKKVSIFRRVFVNHTHTFITYFFLITIFKRRKTKAWPLITTDRWLFNILNAQRKAAKPLIKAKKILAALWFYLLNRNSKVQSPTITLHHFLNTLVDTIEIKRLGSQSNSSGHRGHRKIILG